MNNLSGYTETQLLRFINVTQSDHNEQKKVLLNTLDKYKEVIDKYKEASNEIDDEVENLDGIESRYAELIIELNNRGK
jgi:hypothetical protein